MKFEKDLEWIFKITGVHPLSFCAFFFLLAKQFRFSFGFFVVELRFNVLGYGLLHVRRTDVDNYIYFLKSDEKILGVKHARENWLWIFVLEGCLIQIGTEIGNI